MLTISLVQVIISNILCRINLNLVQVVIFCLHCWQLGGEVGLYGPVPYCSNLIFNPGKRSQVRVGNALMCTCVLFLHTTGVEVPDLLAGPLRAVPRDVQHAGAAGAGDPPGDGARRLAGRHCLPVGNTGGQSLDIRPQGGGQYFVF